MRREKKNRECALEKNSFMSVDIHTETAAGMCWCDVKTNTHRSFSGGMMCKKKKKEENLWR